MNDKLHPNGYPASWSLRCICNGSGKCRMRRNYRATTKRISPHHVYVQSSHNLCANQMILLQLEVPPIHNGDRIRTLEVIGRTMYTFLEGEHFLTKIEFLRFENDARKLLLGSLTDHFGNASPLPKTRDHLIRGLPS